MLLLPVSARKEGNLFIYWDWDVRACRRRGRFAPMERGEDVGTISPSILKNGNKLEIRYCNNRIVCRKFDLQGGVFSFF